MTKRLLPSETEQRFLVFGATGTDLIFNRGVELPGFASFPLNEDPEAQPIIVDQMRDLVKIAQAEGLGCIIDTLTWMANSNRAAPHGYDADRLQTLNRTAVGLMRSLRDEYEAADVLLALCLGPSRDAYAKLPPMSVGEARDYHRVQIGSVKDMGLDLVNAYTFNQTAEAAGAVLAARDCRLPAAMSLVVETDGRLDNGQPLEEAIASVTSEQMAGAISAGAGFFAVVSLVLGRYWQASLYNPGGFGEEFRALRFRKPWQLGLFY